VDDVDPLCRCGHLRDVHQHHSEWRTNCGICGPVLCPAYRRPPSHLSLAAAMRINRLLAILRSRR
jgi:hypothetical protein